MSGLEGIADRFEIEALRGEFTDAVMTHDYDRLASLFTQDGAVVMPHINANARTRDEIRAGVERLQSLWECFVQTTHPGTILCRRRHRDRPCVRLGAHVWTRRLASELRRVSRPLRAHLGRLEIRGAHLRGQIRRHHSGAGLVARRCVKRAEAMLATVRASVSLMVSPLLTFRFAC
jgi:hypothetical protein